MGVMAGLGMAAADIGEAVRATDIPIGGGVILTRTGRLVGE
jgi:hypothetical protein